MSFSLSQIQRRTTTKQDDIKACHWVLKNMDILTENARFAFWKYADFRFTKRNRGKFNGPIFEDMIKELLEYCCNKSYISIGRKDVEKYEVSILYELKNAIYFGATRKLYDATSSYKEFDTSMFKETLDPPKPREDRLTKVEVENYFGDLIV